MDKFPIGNQKRYWERSSLKKRRHPTHPVIASYVLSKIDRIRQSVPITKGTRLLDVGCGNGFFSYYFDKICDVTCIDSSEMMISLNPSSKKFVMNAEQMDFEDNSFDIVFCHALLHHVDNIDSVVREMKRVSRRHVVLLEPNRNNPLMFLFSALVKEERNALQFSIEFMKNFTYRNGLRIEESFSYGMIVPNKTPAVLLPFLNIFNRDIAFGMTNFIISKVPNHT